MPTTLIITILNEADSLRALLDSILSQTRPPDEVVVCDGGSTDSTLAILKEYEKRLPLTVITLPGANISQGRNAAIRAATHDLIASADAGVRLDPDWLARLIAPLESDPSVHVVSGFFQPDPRTPFEVALGATTLPTLRDINPAHFAPSSRSVAFRRSAWERVGGYPEWLDFCEDLIFDFRLAGVAGPFAFAPQAVARFRPRPSLAAFMRQYYQYARGDGKANLFFRRHLIRYLTYGVALPVILIAGFAVSLWMLALFLPGALVMFGPAYRRLPGQWRSLRLPGKIAAFCWVPITRVAGDLAKMVGYPVGLAWRWRNNPPDWRWVE